MQVRRIAAVALLVVTGGVLTGAAAVGLIALLRLVSLISYGAIGEPDLNGTITGNDPVWWVRRLLPPVVGGLLAGLAWWGLRRRGPVPGVDGMVRSATSELGDDGRPATRPRVWWRAVADAATQIVIVAAGASIGREAAPRLAAAGLVTDVTARARISPEVRRVLIAASAGAGLAAVYNVPLTGVVFTATIVLATPAETGGPADDASPESGRSWRRSARIALGSGWSWTAILCSAPMSLIAAMMAWTMIGSGPRLPLPTLTVSGADVAFAAVGGLIAGVVGTAFARLSRRARRTIPRPGPRLPLSIAAVGIACGVVSYWVPIGGNGLLLVEPALQTAVTLPVLAAYVIAKPLMTSAYLRSGAVGGVLMPALSTGAALGGAAGLLTGQSSIAAFCVIGAAACLAASEGAWLFAASITWEMTHAPVALGACVVLAAVIGNLVRFGLNRLLVPRTS